MPLSKKRDRERKRKSNLTGLESNSDSNLIQPKKDYQREYMRKWRSNRNDVRPLVVLDPVRPQLDPKQEKLTELRKLIDVGKGKVVSPWDTEVIHRPPIYDPKKHVKGDLVRKWVNGAWQEVVVPELDELGNVLEEY